MTLSPSKHVNVLYGENAQGKTNIAEAIWLCSGQKSWRAGKEAELVSNGEDFLKITASFHSEDRDQTSGLQIRNSSPPVADWNYGIRNSVFEKTVFLNKIKLPSSAGLSEAFPAVIFSPEHLDLVKEGPMIRRRFLDTAISVLRPKYAAVLSSYNRALAQRGRLLRDYRFDPKSCDISLLDVYENYLSRYGEHIISQRRHYINALCDTAPEIYAGFTGGKETFSLAYVCAGPDKAAEIEASLRSNRSEDARTGATSAGPHRDDLLISVNGMPAKTYGSQGQQRSAVIAVKLAEARVLQRVGCEEPIVILDDVLSELDGGRQDYILNRLHGFQVFITCCDKDLVKSRARCAVFHVYDGRILK